MAHTQKQTEAVQALAASRRQAARKRFVDLCKMLKGQDIALKNCSDAELLATGYPDQSILGSSCHYFAKSDRFVKRLSKGVYRFLPDVLDEAGYVRTTEGLIVPKTVETKPAPQPQPEEPSGTVTGFDRTRAFKGLCCLLNGAQVNVAEITDAIAIRLGWANARSCRSSVRYYSQKETFVGPSVKDENLVFPWREEFCAQALKDYKPESLKPAPVPGNGQPTNGGNSVPNPPAPVPLSAEEELQQLDEQERQLTESKEQLRIQRTKVMERFEAEIQRLIVHYVSAFYAGDVEQAFARLRKTMP